MRRVAIAVLIIALSFSATAAAAPWARLFRGVAGAEERQAAKAMAGAAEKRSAEDAALSRAHQADSHDGYQPGKTRALLRDETSFHSEGAYIPHPRAPSPFTWTPPASAPEPSFDDLLRENKNLRAVVEEQRAALERQAGVVDQMRPKITLLSVDLKAVDFDTAAGLGIKTPQINLIKIEGTVFKVGIVSNSLAAAGYALSGSTANDNVAYQELAAHSFAKDRTFWPPLCLRENGEAYLVPSSARICVDGIAVTTATSWDLSDWSNPPPPVLPR